MATTVVETVGEVGGLPFGSEEKLAYLTQTTLSLDDVKEIAEALIQRYPRIETLPSSSICYATTNRQMALREITAEADVVLVVGDPKSSNSNRLCEVAEKRGCKAFLINSESEILPAWFAGVEVIAMTAGASTPERIVQACIDRLKRLGVMTVEETVYIQEEVFFQLPKQVLV